MLSVKVSEYRHSNPKHEQEGKVKHILKNCKGERKNISGVQVQRQVVCTGLDFTVS